MKDLLGNLTDSYSRVARFYPAVLAFFPVVWTVPALLPNILSFDVPHVVGITAVLSAGVALLMNMARSLGKSTEKRLLSSWGGWPSTIMLRHRDGALDSGTKGRYHAKLQALYKNMALPSAAEEAQAETAADAQYRAATTRLIEARRDAKHKMLHKENAQYGFRRNLLGLKPVALTVVLLASGATGTVIAVGLPSPPATLANLLSDAGVRWQLYVSLLLDVSYTLLFVLLVRPHFVRQAGDEYALALFRTLD